MVGRRNGQVERMTPRPKCRASQKTPATPATTPAKYNPALQRPPSSAWTMPRCSACVGRMPTTPEASALRYVQADLDRPDHQAAVLAMVDAYLARPDGRRRSARG
jgi:hypothetical protein